MAISDNKIMALNTELSRMSEILKTRDQEVQGFKKKEAALNNKLKDQAQMESDYKYLKGVV